MSRQRMRAGVTGRPCHPGGLGWVTSIGVLSWAFTERSTSPWSLCRGSDVTIASIDAIADALFARTGKSVPAFMPPVEA